MKRHIRKRARVPGDLAQHYLFIAHDKLEPAERLLVVAEESFERLAEWPEVGLAWVSNRTSHQGIRFYPMPPPYRAYLIFYRATDEVLDVLAVLHAARDLKQVVNDLF